MKKIKILSFVGYYLPGYKSGGPIRTMSNMVNRLGDVFNFSIVTSDSDLGDSTPYRNVKINKWNNLGKETVYYISRENYTLFRIHTIINTTDHNIIYLNSLFSPIFTLKPLLLRLFHLVPRKPWVLAPRGELSPGALRLKHFRKTIFLTIARAVGLYSNIIWQASSEYEKNEILKWFGSVAKVYIAPNIPFLSKKTLKVKKNIDKKVGRLRIVFLSRISPKKNLAGALKMLRGLEGEISISIFGPIEDKIYWKTCQRLMNDLPQNIKATYCGIVKHDKVRGIMESHELFLFPTLGENYGHVIVEALSAGCPILISDQTPWRDMEKYGVGWDIPLDGMTRFKETLQYVIFMNRKEYSKMSVNAQEYGLNVEKDETVIDQNRQLFFNQLEVTI
jgi:glycosyltransferase involved in cell wall biosynthesis